MTEPTDYKNLTQACGMDLGGAGRVLGISHDTSRQWGCGSRPVPIWAIGRLTKLAEYIEKEIRKK